MNRKIFNVAIVGLGNIGMGYDLDLSGSDFVLSHARAFAQSSHFNLLLGVEKNPKLREKFRDTFSVDAVDKIVNYEGIDNIDLVVIATPTSSHWATINEVLELKSLKMVLCEKPLANNFADALSITKACEAKNVPLFVNFIRRAEPSVMVIREYVIEGKFKPPFFGSINYSKGLFNTASHFTDLLEFWFGAPIAVDRLGDYQTITSLDDFSVDFQVKFPEGHINFYSSSCASVANFDLEIVFQNGRLNYTNENRIFWYETEADQVDIGLERKRGNAISFPSEMNMYQKNVVDELYKALTGRSHLLCHAKDALSWNLEFEKMLVNEGSY